VVAYHMDYMPTVGIIENFKSNISEFKNDFYYKSISIALEYIEKQLIFNNGAIEKAIELKDIENIKRINFDGMYDNHFSTRNKIEELHKHAENYTDKKSKVILKLTGAILSQCNKFEWICCDLENLADSCDLAS